MTLEDAANICLRMQNNQSTLEVTQPDYSLDNTEAASCALSLWSAIRGQLLNLEPHLFLQVSAVPKI